VNSCLQVFLLKLFKIFWFLLALFIFPNFTLINIILRVELKLLFLTPRYGYIKVNSFIWKPISYATATYILKNKCKSEAYVYWTVHHLDSWIKRDQLDVTCFIISLFTAQHVSDVNTSNLRSFATYLLSYFMGCIALVGLVWYLYAGFSLHTDTTPHHPSQTTT